MIQAGKEPRQSTSNVGFLNKPSIQALIHNLNRHYYSESFCFVANEKRSNVGLRNVDACGRFSFCVGINIDYRKSEAEQGMLMNLHKKGWTEGLKMEDFCKHKEGNEVAVKVRDFPLTFRCLIIVFLD